MQFYLNVCSQLYMQAVEITGSSLVNQANMQLDPMYVYLEEIPIGFNGTCSYLSKCAWDFCLMYSINNPVH